MTISDYIRQDIESRIRSGSDLPAELTLGALSAHYSVSFTPVRSAVRELIAAGVLKKGKNRRLSPAENLGPAQATAVELEPPEIVDDLFDRVAHDLVGLSLEGKVVSLREEVTARQYGVSRSMIRNIFHRLAGAGMLDHLPRRGWRLRPFRQADMEAFLEVRDALELKALDLAFPHLNDDDLAELLNRNRFPNNGSDAPQIDNSLHEYLIESAGNPYIADFFQRHGRYYDLLFDWEDLDRETAIETVRQHREILEALLARRQDAAREALSYHIRCNHPILSRIAASISRG